MLGALRRIEDSTGVMAVLPAVRGMSAMVTEFARETRTARADAVTLATEVTQYRGWLEHRRTEWLASTLRKIDPDMTDDA